MGTQNINSRRKFIGALALGATASSISVLTNPIYGKSKFEDPVHMNEADAWFKKIKGSHRIVYDGSTRMVVFPSSGTGLFI